MSSSVSSAFTNTSNTSSLSSPSSSNAVNACLNILRRLPPSDISENVEKLTKVISKKEKGGAEELIHRSHHIPLKSATDPKSNDRAYILCDYNQEQQSHRSPWSNEYDPPLKNESTTSSPYGPPSPRLRHLEIHANEVFDSYRELYYGSNAICSVYLWEAGRGGGKPMTVNTLNGAILISNKTESGFWNSVHMVDVGTISGGGKVMYKLTSTITFSMQEGGGKTDLSGSLTRQLERLCVVGGESDHVVNMGKLVEEIEIDMRSSLESIYVSKTKEVLSTVRSGSEGMAAPPPRRGVGGVAVGGGGGGGGGGPMNQHMMMLNQAVLGRKKGSASSGGS